MDYSNNFGLWRVLRLKWAFEIPYQVVQWKSSYASLKQKEKEYLKCLMFIGLFRVTLLNPNFQNQAKCKILSIWNKFF